MTKHTNTIEGCRGFSWLNPQGVFKCPALLQIAVLAAVLFQFASIGHAQGNLGDLYNWKDDSAPITGLIDIYSCNSATFIGNYANFPGLNQLSLSGGLNTTPGATYQISFTLQDTGIGDFDGTGDLWFGSSEMNLNSTFEDGHITGNGYAFAPVNYDFTAVATSSTTSMSFDFVLDQGLNADLSNLQITIVPEISTSRLFCYGGFVLVLAGQLRKLNQKRVLAKAKA